MSVPLVVADGTDDASGGATVDNQLQRTGSNEVRQHHGLQQMQRVASSESGRSQQRGQSVRAGRSRLAQASAPGLLSPLLVLAISLSVECTTNVIRLPNSVLV